MNNRFFYKPSPILLLLGVATFFCLAACSENDDAALIRNLIKTGAALAEEHNINDLLQLTSEDFLAQGGKLNHRQVKQYLWLVFKRYGKFHVLYPVPAIELAENGRSAKVEFYFLIVKKEQSFPNLKKLYRDPQRWLEEVGENADPYRLNAKLKKNSGAWLVSTAKIETFRGFGFSE